MFSADVYRNEVSGTKFRTIDTKEVGIAIVGLVGSVLPVLSRTTGIKLNSPSAEATVLTLNPFHSFWSINNQVVSTVTSIRKKYGVVSFEKRSKNVCFGAITDHNRVFPRHRNSVSLIVETQERNQLVLDISKDLGAKLGLEMTVQEACNPVDGLRISEIVMAFSEGLRTSLPIFGKVVDRETLLQIEDDDASRMGDGDPQVPAV